MLQKIQSKLIKYINTVYSPGALFLPNGHKGTFILKRRIMRRYSRVRKRFTNKEHAYTFSDLFDLPEWITLDKWLRIQLRGRGVESLYLLTIDHIVPLSQARDLDELKKLMSWENTRLLDIDINSEKSSQIDNEVRLLCFTLLKRFPDGDNIEGTKAFKKKMQKAVNKMNKI